MVGLFVVGIIGLGLWLNKGRTVEAAWFNDSWGFRNAVPVSAHTAAETNKYVSVTLDSSANFQSDCGDLRWTDEGGNLLPYYIVSGCGGASTVTHVFLKSFPAGAQTLYYYYGNTSVVNGFSSADFATEASNYTIGTIGSQEKAKGPVAYWDFDEGVGTTAHDKTSNLNHGVVSDATWQSESLCISGKCLSFDSSSGNVSVPSNSTIPTGASPRTVSMWVRTTGDSWAADDNPLFEYGNSSTREAFGVDLDTFPMIQIYTWDDDAMVDTGLADKSSWWHIEIVYDGDTTILTYVNGRLRDTHTLGAPLDTVSTDVNIGRSLLVPNSFDGFIDEPKIYNYARSAEQVKLDYNSQTVSLAKGAGTALGGQNQDFLSNGLVGYWKMDETSWTNNCSTAAALDSSGNGKDAVSCPNGTGPTGGVAGKYGNGGDFNSASDQRLSVGAVNTVLDITGAQTVSMWVNIDVDQAQGLMSRSGNSGDPGFRLALNSGNTAEFVVADSGNVSYSSGVSSALTTGVWYHIVGVYAPSKAVQIYVNGKLSNQNTTQIPSSQRVSINYNSIWFARDANDDGPFDGKLDETRIYNRALSPSEVVQLYELAPGPVGYWNFEDAAHGSAVADVSGYENNGSWSGTGSRWVNGKVGKAGKFNGSDSYTSIANSTSLQPKNVTVGAWFKLASTPSYATIVSKSYTAAPWTSPYVSWLIRVNSSTSLEMDVGNGTTYSAATFTVSALTLNQWYYASFTYDGTTLRAYLNGNLIGTDTTVSGNIGYASQPVLIGADYGASPVGDYFPGQIDEVTIYNYARTPAQIIDEVTARLALGGKTGGAAGWWDFDEGQGTVAHDRSGNGNDGTLSGMSSPASVGTSGWNPNGKVNRGLSFDGRNDYVSLASTHASSYPFTYSLWARANSASGTQIIMGTNTVCSGGAGNAQVYIGSASWKADICGSSASVVSAPVTVGQWTHLVAVYESDTSRKLYVNGVLVGSTKNSLTTTSNVSRFGSRQNDSLYFNGSLDEIKIYNYPLTASEVQTEFNETKALVLGSFSDTSRLSGGSVASNSASAIYCVPGDTATCAVPIMEWELEEGVGTSVADTSGNALSGTWNGTAPFWGQGKQGWGAKSNGSDSYLETGDSSLLNLTGSSFTIQYWIKTLSTGFSTPFMIRDTSGNDSGILGGLPINVTTGKASFDTWNYSGNRVTGSVTVNDGKWHHIVGTYNSGTGLATLYVDGAIDGSGAQIGSTANANKRLRIGANVNTSGAFLQGYSGLVDGVKVYNYARSPAQVAWDFNKGKAISYYDFDECQGTVIHNSGVYGTVGTWSGSGGGTQTAVGTCTSSGTTAWYQGRNGKFDGSMNFDGTDDYIDLGNNENVDISGVISISAWVKVASFGSSGQYKGIVSKVTGSSPYGGYQLNTDADSGNRFGMGMNISGTWRSMQTNGTYQTGTWYHLVATYDGSLMKIYVNGKLNNSRAYSGSLELVAQNAFIGKNGSDDANMRFSGQIDDVRLFSYPLTEVQVRQQYNEGFGIRFGPSAGTP